MRTYLNLACFSGLHGAYAVPDKERQVEQVLHGLPEVVGVDNEFEHVDGGMRLKYLAHLKMLLW